MSSCQIGLRFLNGNKNNSIPTSFPMLPQLNNYEMEEIS